MLDKTGRIEQLTAVLAEKLGLDEKQKEAAARIAQLCKADLASEMVVEMTALQGVMGKYYARNSGESEEVAAGLFDYYLPRTTEDPLPESKSAMVVGLADRLDSIVGLFAVGLIPTGNKDPFALRRAAIGLVSILMGKELDFDLREALVEAGKVQKVAVTDEVIEKALAFIAGRMHNILLDEGYRYDVVEAIEAVQAKNPGLAKPMVETLNEWVEKQIWADVLPAFSRCVRMTRDLKDVFTVDESILVEEEEKTLYNIVLKAEESLAGSFDLELTLEQISSLMTPINAFFDKVLVMAEDQVLRESRLGILQRIAGLIKPYADFSKLEGF